MTFKNYFNEIDLANFRKRLKVIEDGIFKSYLKTQSTYFDPDTANDILTLFSIPSDIRIKIPLHTLIITAARGPDTEDRVMSLEDILQVIKAQIKNWEKDLEIDQRYGLSSSCKLLK